MPLLPPAPETMKVLGKESPVDEGVRDRDEFERLAGFSRTDVRDRRVLAGPLFPAFGSSGRAAGQGRRTFPKRPDPGIPKDANGTGTRLPVPFRDKFSSSPSAIPLCRVACRIEQPDTRRGLATAPGRIGGALCVSVDGDNGPAPAGAFIHVDAHERRTLPFETKKREFPQFSRFRLKTMAAVCAWCLASAVFRRLIPCASRILLSPWPR